MEIPHFFGGLRFGGDVVLAKQYGSACCLTESDPANVGEGGSFAGSDSVNCIDSMNR